MINSVLTRPKSLEGLYRTYFSFANKFEFTSLLRNYIQNEEWKDTSTDRVWSMLAKVSDDIGAVLTDGIVNYTRNVVDINTCKLPQLIEHSRMLSYGLDHIKNSYDFFPNRIKCLVDIFSVNPEYLLGNNQNHILSDQVIKEILIYIRENSKDKIPFTNENLIDKLIDDPHSLTNANTYRNFVTVLFFQTIVDELMTTYSDTSMPIAFNMLFNEMMHSESVLSKIDEYKSWVDKFIWNEIEHPLNNIGQKISDFANLVSNTKVDDLVLPNTIGYDIQMIKEQKKMSSKFNPFHLADAIYFNGLSPTNGLSQDELDLIEMVLGFHSKPMYNYQQEQFSDDLTTQYAYYRELEFCEYLKMIIFISNNLNSFILSGLTYDIISNKFIQQNNNAINSMRVVQIFNQNGEIVKNSNGTVALNYQLILKVARFLCDFVFGIQGIRENIKTIAQKHAMRGTGALLVHLVNDYLIKELPSIRDRLNESVNDVLFDFKFGWELEQKYNHYVNVKIIEYEDDNEYFNIEPDKDVRFTDRTNARYWEKLDGLGDDDTLGVLTKKQIRDFYRDVLGLGRLQQRKSSDYDDIQDFLIDLFKIGANPIEHKGDELYNPIDDILNKSEEDYGYTKQERLDVQNNVQLRENQSEQFLEYSGNDDIVANEIYDLTSNRIFYWKNTDYSSHVLHPFMYNLKIWNKLNNIIINGYKDYINSDLIDLMSTKVKFDEVFGEYGEGKNFWKYNITDLTGYTTRYEAAIKNEHKDDDNKTISELTGYDGLFYPGAAKEFVDLFKSTTDFSFDSRFFTNELYVKNEDGKFDWVDGTSEFMKAIYSIYWQLYDGMDTFYRRWYSHLNYTRDEYQKIAIQLWYWRDRIVELITTNYPIKKYCLDIQGNSLILVSTFNEQDTDNNPYLIDLAVQQNAVEDGITINGYEYRLNRNNNEHVPFCDNRLNVPSEMWVRWKSNPIALPAFDVKIDKTKDDEFNIRYRDEQMVEFGQLTYLNGKCNQYIRRIVDNWNSTYGTSIEQNKFPVFFDMEQSANVLALSSWNLTKLKTPDIYDDDDDVIENKSYMVNCAKNPFHLISIERTSSFPSEYNWEEYSDNAIVNGNEQTIQWLFDSYHYCPANGSLLLPLYRFDCTDLGQQKLSIRLFVIPAQQIKNDNYTVGGQIEVLNIGQDGIDLNSAVDIYSTDKMVYQKPLFDRQMMVCRNTNLVFSPYSDENGMNRVKCAFLGCFVDDKDEYSRFKVSSCGAKTRYELDSKQTNELALLKGRYYRENGAEYGDNSNVVINYFDDDVANSFNSYDSNDKYVMVIDIVPSIDNGYLFKNSTVKIKSSSYNILSDAGYIPHFAYQSLVKYADSEGGIAYTWVNDYLKTKEHFSFELLGLDDKKIPKEYDLMNRMVVEDLTDNCFTLLNPTKLTQDIYRIWCESIDAENKYGHFDSNGNWVSGGNDYFQNEYAQFVNEDIEFDDNGFAVWNIDSKFEVSTVLNCEQNRINEILDDYYISILRTSNGDILNEKKYILPMTKISQIMTPLSDIVATDNTNQGYYTCNLDEFNTSLIQDEHFVPVQVVFTGTQNPFNSEHNGNTGSRPELLQYGNGIRGVEKIEVKLDFDTQFYLIDDFDAVMETDGNTPLMDGDKYVIDTPDGRKSVQVDSDGNVLDINGSRIIKSCVINPSIRLTKKQGSGDTLLDKYQKDANLVEAGSIMVILSHKNLDNIAKYHMLNRKTNLYFDGSLPKNYMNEFKYSDFKSNTKRNITYISSGWVIEGIENVFSDSDVLGSIPPYYVEYSGQRWYLEQDAIQEHGNRIIVNQYSDGQTIGVVEQIPGKGNFKHAYLKSDSITSYLDYLYVRNGGLAFKVNEESNSFSDIMNRFPGFKVDEKLINKLIDLNDVHVMNEYSTFIHQSENPLLVSNCGCFNPLRISAIIKYGIEQVDGSEPIICTEPYDVLGQKIQDNIIELSNTSSMENVSLQLEDEEIDDYLKIYTNYVKVDDGNGDFHFDLYFNIQNLFHSPFEYISSVTNQPNVLIIPDSYLYLSGDKYRKTISENGSIVNLIDSDKMNLIKQGGTLTIYGQVKTYSNDILNDVKTIKLFQYQVYNTSDDKPKFLIKKIFDITKSQLENNQDKQIKIQFSDVLFTISEDKFVGNSDQIQQLERQISTCDSEDTVKKLREKLNFIKRNKFTLLNEDITVVQPIKIHYDWQPTDDIRSVSFDIVNDIIDFNQVPELLGLYDQERTLRNGEYSNTDYLMSVKNLPYYDHWSGKHINLETNPETGSARMTLNFIDGGYNFETLYLKWRLPRGFNLMDTIDRLRGWIFTSTAENIEYESNGKTPKSVVIDGHVTARVANIGEMNIGMEHSTTNRKNGYVLTGLSTALREAIKNSIKEQGIKVQ